MPGQDAESGKWGRIEKRGNSLRVRVYAGDDPVTGRRVYHNEAVRGTDRAAEKRAQKVLTRLLAEVPAEQVAATLRQWGEHNVADELQAALVAGDDEAARDMAGQLGIAYEVAETG